MWLVSLCALLVVIQSSLGDSFASLVVALAAVSAAVLTEFLFLFWTGRAGILKDGSAVASALILALLLPNKIHPLYAAAGAVFAIAVVKHSFGGLGSNWLNPAAAGWLFIRFSWPGAFRNALEGSPLSLLAESMGRGVTNPEGSPLGILKIDAANLFAASSSLDTTIRSFLNNTVFSLTGAELPGGYLDLFVSRFPGIIADRGVLALFAGTVIITASQVNRSWIPLAYLAVFGCLVRLAGALPFGENVGNGDVLFALCSGGTLAAAFFLSADPATGAKSNAGILFAAATAGGIGFFFRYYGGEPYGVIFAAVLINAALPLVRIIESKLFYERRGGQEYLSKETLSRRQP
jgi:electron transport complex protein RnfD